MNKVIFGFMFVILMTSFASAGWFDWLKKDDQGVETPLISDTFNKIKTKIETYFICQKEVKEIRFCNDKEKEKGNEIDTGEHIKILENNEGVQIVYNEA